jgi:hypothetical protein
MTFNRLLRKNENSDEGDGALLHKPKENIQKVTIIFIHFKVFGPIDFRIRSSSTKAALI